MDFIIRNAALCSVLTNKILSIMTTTKRDTLAAINKPVTSSKVITGARNSFEIVYEDGSIGYRLHKTDIVTLNPNGSVTLNSGGWLTVTTKERMDQFARPYGLQISQFKGLWYVHTPKGKFDFYDGITFNAAGKPDKVITTDTKKIDELRKEISKFVSLVDKVETLPKPSNGDCWDCSMKTKEGKSMGELSHSDHLLTHVKEGYLHGSLIVNALLSKGYAEWQLPFVFQIRPIVKRALRTYLQNKLITNIQVN